MSRKKNKNKGRKNKHPQQHPKAPPVQEQAQVPEQVHEEQTVSPQKLEANRQNAQHSTGPKTDVGKSKAAMNSAKHYLTSKKVIIPSEDEDEFHYFQEAILIEMQPVGFLEFAKVKRYAVNAWRLNRVYRYEQEVNTNIKDTVEKMTQLINLCRYEREIRREMEKDLAEFRHSQRNGTFDAIEQERHRREEAAKETGEPVEMTDLIAASFRVIRHTLPVKQMLEFITTPARGDLFGFVSQGVPPPTGEQAA
jgi:hypothetical protein